MHIHNELLAAGRRGEKWTARISATQRRAYESAITEVDPTITPELLAECDAYVATGDLSEISQNTRHVLKLIAEHAKPLLSESQQRRIWPRKTACALILHVAESDE